MARQAAVATTIITFVKESPQARAAVACLAGHEEANPRGYVRGPIIHDHVRQTTGKAPFDAFARLTALGVVEAQPNARDESQAGPDAWRLSEVGLSLAEKLGMFYTTSTAARAEKPAAKGKRPVRAYPPAVELDEHEGLEEHEEHEEPDKADHAISRANKADLGIEPAPVWRKPKDRQPELAKPRGKPGPKPKPKPKPKPAAE